MTIKELYSLYCQCGSLTTDSRNCPEGSMFIALKGESFDGRRRRQIYIGKRRLADL